MAMDIKTTLQTLVDIEAIKNVLALHSRAIDRCDAEQLKSTYHADAKVAYGFFDGMAYEFCDMVTSVTRGGPVTLHRTQNMWIKLDKDSAKSESYVIAYLHVEGDEGSVQSLIGGRYLDRHERRNGEWRLAHRGYVMDWNLNQTGSGTALADYVSPFTRGAYDRDDPGNQLLEAWNTQKDTTAELGDREMQVPASLIVAAEAAMAKQEIHDLIMSQARAVDRSDAELFKSVWHEYATADIGIYEGSAEDLCPFLMDATKDMKCMFHSVANEWIKVDKLTAVSESYVIAYSRNEEEGAEVDRITGGRYLDKFESRNGVWKFNHRKFIMDYVIEQPSSFQSDGAMYETLKIRGARFPEDPVYAFWNN